MRITIDKLTPEQFQELYQEARIEEENGMGKITIEAYGKIVYDRALPDNVCFAIFKEREAKDNEFKKKVEENKQLNFRNDKSQIET